jgi:transcriptional regulator with XRE-family HTH domain
MEMTSTSTLTRPADRDRHIALGLRIKYLRRSRGLRLKDVADLAGCSESMLSKVENGQSTPSINMLHRIARALGTSIGELFTELDDRKVHVLRAGTRPALSEGAPRRGKGIKLESLTPFILRGLLQAQLHVIDVGGASDGAIEHEGEEVGYVVEGRLELTVDGESVVLEPGDSFFFESTRPHSYRNVGDTVARVVWVNSPPTY